MRYLFFFLSLIVGIHAKAQSGFPTERFCDWQQNDIFHLSDSLYQLYTSDLLNLDSSGQQDCGAAVNSFLLLHQLDTIRLHFKPGMYLFNEPLVLQSNLIIEGEGPEQTHLNFNLNGTQSSILANGSVQGSVSMVSNLPVKNDTILVCANHTFQMGDWIYLKCQDAGLITSSWALGTVGQLLQIKYVWGDSLILLAPIRRSYTNEGPCYAVKFIPKENIMLRCFSIERIDNTAPEQSSSIDLTYVVNSEIQSIYSHNCTFAHVSLNACSNIEVAKCFFQDAFDYGEGGRAYGVVLQSSTGQCRIEDNIFKHLRHAILFQSGANGNVAAFNFSTDAYWTNSTPLLGTTSAGDLVLHGNYVYANLLEQNVVNNIVIDNSHGANGPDNLFYRNRAKLYGIFFSDQTSPNQLFIGNEVSNTAFPYSLVNYTIQGTGHYQFANNNKGTIVPSGTSFQSDTSFAYSFKPDFVHSSMWLTIGAQPTFNLPIPAEQRFETQNYFATSCGQSDAGLDIIEMKFQLYPNPVSDEMKVVFSKPFFGKMALANLEGQVLRVQQVQNKSIVLSLHDLPAGCYWLQIEGNSKPKRIIKL